MAFSDSLQDSFHGLQKNAFFQQNFIAVTLSIAIAAYLVVNFIYPVAKRIQKFRKAKKIAGGPKPHWFWGDIKAYGITHEGFRNSLKRCNEFPAISTYYVGLMGTYHCYHPDIAKTLLTRELPKSFAYKNFVRVIMRDGLVISDGKLWKYHRRLLTICFHFDILKEHLKIFNKNYKVFFDKFDDIAKKNTAYDVTRVIGLTTYTNMMECVMSQEVKESSQDSLTFFNNVNRASYLIVERQQNPFHWWTPIFERSKSGKELMAIQKCLFDKIGMIIDERRALLNSLGNSATGLDTSEIVDSATGKTFRIKKRKGRSMDFLDCLLQTQNQEGEGLTDVEVKDEVITFFCAGMETVATSTAWTLYLLAKHPEIQSRCREEIKREIGDKETYEMSDLSKLSYVAQCIKESLRLYPPVPFLGRQLSEDMTFSHRFNDYKPFTIPKGTNVTVTVYIMHRNPHLWENPDVFDPERFNSENISKIAPFAYVPFGAGPRNCIGQNFGISELKLFIAKTLRSFEVSWDPRNPEPKTNPGVTMPPKDGIPLIVKRL